MTNNHAQCLLFHNRPVMSVKELETASGMAIPVCGECYEKFCGKGVPFTIARYDGESELEVLDREGRRIDHGQLWFYQKSAVLPARKICTEIASHIRKSNEHLWSVARLVLKIKEEETWSVLGYNSLYDLMKTLGLDTARTKRLCRVAKCLCSWSSDDEIPSVLYKISPDVADQYRKMSLVEIEQELSGIEI